MPGVLNSIGVGAQRWRERRRPSAPPASQIAAFNDFIVDVPRFRETQRIAIHHMAVILDEQVPGWHLRITRPLEMASVSSCVLGQIFAGDEPLNGYSYGAQYLMSRGISWSNGIFSDPAVVPYWVREITARH